MQTRKENIITKLQFWMPSRIVVFSLQSSSSTQWMVASFQFLEICCCYLAHCWGKPSKYLKLLLKTHRTWKLRIFWNNNWQILYPVQYLFAFLRRLLIETCLNLYRLIPLEVILLQSSCCQILILILLSVWWNLFPLGKLVASGRNGLDVCFSIKGLGKLLKNKKCIF